MLKPIADHLSQALGFTKFYSEEIKMKFNQVTALAAAAIIIPLGGTIAHFSNSTESALAESNQPTRLAQTPENDSPEQGKRKRWGKDRKGKYLEQLGLTDAQKAEIETIRQDARSNGQNKRKEMRAAHGKMRELFASDASKEQLRTQFRETQRLRQASHEQHFETKLKIRDVLTTEQRTKLGELMAEKRGRRGRRGPGGPGAPQSFGS